MNAWVNGNLYDKMYYIQLFWIEFSAKFFFTRFRRNEKTNLDKIQNAFYTAQYTFSINPFENIKSPTQPSLQRPS